MITTIEMAQSSDKKLRDAGITRIIENAGKLVNDPEWDKKRVYQLAAELITDCIPDHLLFERQQAIQRLKEALQI